MLPLNYTAYIEKKWVEIYKMPLIYENLRISRMFYLSKYTFWGNPMLFNLEKKFLKLKITVLAIFWVWSCTSYNIWLWFQSSGNSKKYLLNKWIKTIFQYHNALLCDIGRLTGLEFLEQVYLNAHILLYNLSTFKHCWSLPAVLPSSEFGHLPLST